MEQFILLAPLVAALIAGFGWRVISEQGAQILTTGVLFICAAFSWLLFFGFDGQPYRIHLMDWIVAGDFAAEWAIRIDRLTLVMLIVVTTVSALVRC